MKKLIFLILLSLICLNAYAVSTDKRIVDNDGDVLAINSDGTVPVSLSGTLGIANGGTGLTSFDSGAVLYTNNSGEVSYDTVKVSFDSAISTLTVGVPSAVARGVAGDGPNIITSITTGSGRNALFEDTSNSSSTAGGTIIVAAHDGAALASGDRVGAYQWSGQRTSGGTAQGAEIEAFAVTDWSNTSAPTKIIVSLIPTGSTTRQNVMEVSSDRTIIGYGTIKVLETNTGGNAGTDLCIDANNRICACTTCA